MSLVGGDDEVDRGADHRGERPGDADGRELGAGQQVEDQHQAEGGQPGTDEGQRPGPLTVAQPQVDHDGGGRGELDEQRRPDLHVRDRGEVAELGAGHRHGAVERDQPGVAAQQPPSTPQGEQPERREQEGREPDPDQDDRARAPAGVEQPSGQCTGQAERGGRDHG